MFHVCIRKISWGYCWVGCWLIISVGCSTKETNRTTIGPEGGVIQKPSGVILEVPAGALQAKTEITIQTYAWDTLPEAMQSAVLDIDGAVELGPTGTTFQKPAILTFPVGEILTPGAPVGLYYRDELNAQWIQTPTEGTVTEDGQHVRVEITHFSLYGSSAHFRIRIAKVYWDSPEATYYEAQHQLQAQAQQSILAMGCCAMVRRIEYDFSYLKEGQPGSDHSVWEESSAGMRPMIYRETIIVEDGNPAGPNYFRMQAVMIFFVVEPEYLDMRLDVEPRVLNLDQEEREASLTAYVYCHASPLPGAMIELAVNGPGRVSPERFAAGHNGMRATYYAEGDDPAAVGIEATYVGCQDQGAGQQKSISQQISLTACRDWIMSVDLNIVQAWDDSGPYTYFLDEMIFDVDLTSIDQETGVVAGRFSCSQIASIEGASCPITNQSFPVFSGTLSGSLADNTLSLTFAPESLVASFTMDCGGQPVTIPYGSLLQALIAKDVKVIIPFEEGAAYDQGGEEPFGEDVPFQYSYKAVLSCR